MRLKICAICIIAIFSGFYCYSDDANLIIISRTDGMGINAVKADYKFAIRRKETNVELKVTDLVLEIEQKIDMAAFSQEMVEQIEKTLPEGVPEKIRFDFSDPEFKKEHEGKMIILEKTEDSPNKTWRLIKDETAESSDPKMFPPLALGNSVVELWSGEPDTDSPYWIPVEDVVRKSFSGNSQNNYYCSNFVIIPEVNRPIFISRMLSGSKNGVPTMSIIDKDLSMGEEAKTFINCSWLIMQSKPNVSINTFIQSIDKLIAAKDKDLLDRSKPLRQLGNSCLLEQ